MLSKTNAFLFIAITHPFLFVLYIVVTMAGAMLIHTGYLPEVMKVNAFYHTSPSTYKINLFFYIPFTLMAYGVWLWLQTQLVRCWGKITPSEFVTMKLCRRSPLLIGLFACPNLAMWSVSLGMQSIVFGTIFGPIQLILLFFSFSRWLTDCIEAFWRPPSEST